MELRGRPRLGGIIYLPLKKNRKSIMSLTKKKTIMSEFHVDKGACMA
jgi:hypothetical protein